MSNLLLFSSVGSWIMTAFYRVCLLIDRIIYDFVSFNYRVFYFVSRVNMFGTAELKTITNRIYLILGVVMLFVFAYNIILMLANPDDLSKTDDKSFQGLAKNLIISIIMLTLLPTFFNYLQRLQNNILSSGVIQNVILGGWSENTNYSVKEAGRYTSLTILEAFFHPIVNDESVGAAECAQLADEGAEDTGLCDTYLTAIQQSEEAGNFLPFIGNDDLINGIYDGSMEYYPLVSSVAGIIAAWMFLSFAMDVGLRMAKMGFLEIIAPIPITLRVFKPNGGTFSRWFSELSKTYLSLFIRLVFVFFSMYTISLVPTVLDSIWSNGTGEGTFSSTNKPDSVLVSSQNITTNKISFLTNTTENNTLNPIINTPSKSDNNIVLTASSSETKPGLMVRSLSIVIIILGILKFAKEGPGMAEKLFAMEHIELNIQKKLGEVPVVGKPMAHALGSAKGYVAGAAGGAFLGLQQGIRTGNFKPMKGFIRQGAAGGANGGGFEQFLKQRKSIFESTNPGKELGMFGGYSINQRLKDEYGTAGKQAVNEARQRDILDFEKSREFHDAFVSITEPKDIEKRLDALRQNAEIKNAEDMADKYCQSRGIAHNDPRYQTEFNNYIDNIRKTTTNAALKRQLATYQRDMKLKMDYLTPLADLTSRITYAQNACEKASNELASIDPIQKPDEYAKKLQELTEANATYSQLTAEHKELSNKFLEAGKASTSAVFLGKASLDAEGSDMTDARYKDAVSMLKKTTEFDDENLSDYQRWVKSTMKDGSIPPAAATPPPSSPSSKPKP